MPATTYAFVVVPLIVLAIIVAALVFVRVSAARLAANDPAGPASPKDGDRPVGHLAGSATAQSWPPSSAVG